MSETATQRIEKARQRVIQRMRVPTVADYDRTKAAQVDLAAVDALIAAVRAEVEAKLMAERPTEPLKLNLYGRACYRAGQQSRVPAPVETAADTQWDEKAKWFRAGRQSAFDGLVAHFNECIPGRYVDPLAESAPPADQTDPGEKRNNALGAWPELPHDSGAVKDE